MEQRMLIKAALWITILFLTGFAAYGLYNPLSVSKVTVNADAINSPVRIALVSDLHSCRYGKGQCKLTSALDELALDLVCLSGDIFDDRRSDDNTEAFLAEISGKYPCYYVTGNHECRSAAGAFQSKMNILEKYGIVRLSDESREIELQGQSLCICGVDDPEFGGPGSVRSITGVLARVSQSQPDSAFTVLLSHRPEYFSEYAACGFDLILCGHAHGGQWRIPKLLENGLLAPNQGLFPKYTNGKYASGNSVMVVSRGLAKESTIVPRFYNKPEIVIVEIKQSDL